MTQEITMTYDHASNRFVVRRAAESLVVHEEELARIGRIRGHIRTWDQMGHDSCIKFPTYPLLCEFYRETDPGLAAFLIPEQPPACGYWPQQQ